ncbi:MAG: hypothetical protein D3908_12040 [Candidatus Electrothrix sp. AUS4]|nr:hypothetical protein [Candidatus Electrothrix sp. AUS4]
MGVIFFCFLLTSVALGDNKTGWLDDKVTIRFQNEAMSVVLGKISAQTGVAILYDENLKDHEVTGNYKRIKFSEAINRLFSEKNKSIQVFNNEKRILVKTFGAKQFVLVGNNNVADSQGGPKGMTLAELEKMHEQQYKEFKGSISDDNLILDGDMTLGKLKAMHKKQKEALLAELKNPRAIVRDGNMTLGELGALHASQKKEMQLSLEKQDTLFPNGMIRSEITAMHRKQKEVLDATLRNDDYLIDDGMSLGQLRMLHERQLKEIEK